MTAAPVAINANTFNAATGNAIVPGAAQEGDLLLLSSVRSANAAAPAVPSGWTQLGIQTATSLTTVVYARICDADDAGSNVLLDWGTLGRVNWMLAAYRGVSEGGVADVVISFAFALSAAASVTHTTPSIVAVTDDVLSVDLVVTKTATAETNFTPPAGVTRDAQLLVSATSVPHMAIGHENTPINTGESGGGNAWTTVQSSQWIAATILLRAGEEVVPEPGTVDYIRPGGQRHDRVTVTALTSAMTSVRVAASVNPDMSGTLNYSSPVEPDSFDYVKATVLGLDPNTRYYFQLEDTPEGGEAELVGPIGNTMTLGTPGVRTSFDWVHGGCVKTLTDIGTLALQAAQAVTPAFGVLNGDPFYNGDTASTETQWVAKFNNQFTGVANYDSFLASGLGAFACRSDHDTTNVDNGDSNNSWLAVEQAAWKRVTPYDAIGASDCFDQIWDSGRFSFFMLDIRQAYRSPGAMTDGSTKTMLGEDQWTRLEEWFATNPAKFKIVISDVQLLGPTSAGATKIDAWFAYGTDRTRFVNLVDEYTGPGTDTPGFAFVHGDAHGLGYCTPEENPLGNFPVYVAAPYSQDGGGVQSSAFTEYFNNGSADAQQFGIFRCNDDVDGEMSLDFEGWNAITDSAVMNYTHTVSLEAYTSWVKTSSGLIPVSNSWVKTETGPVAGNIIGVKS